MSFWFSILIMIRKLHFALFILFLCRESQASEITYRFCYDSYPPHTIASGGTSTKGTKTEIVLALAKAKGFKAEVQILPWARCQEEVKKGRIDAILPLFKTPEREEFLQFSQKVMEQDSAFFYRKTQFKNGLKWNRFQDLKTYRLGMVRESSIDKTLEDVFTSDERQIFRAHDAKNLIQLLTAERVDLIALDRLVGSFLIRENNLQSQLESSRQKIRSESVYFGVSKSARGNDLLVSINSFLNDPNGPKVVRKILENYSAR